MAGSYEHVVTAAGNLCSNEAFVKRIENLGDAYEAVEELFGMVWYLASQATDPRAAVEDARLHYPGGLAAARRINREVGE